MNSKNIFFLNGVTKNYPYTSHRQGGGKVSTSPRDRLSHGELIKKKLMEAWKKQQVEKKEAVSVITKSGTYLEFIGAPDYDLASKSLEDDRAGIKLLNIRKENVDGKTVVKSTIYIPKGKEQHFFKKIEAYLTKIDKRSNKPCNQTLVNSIEDVTTVVMESFWSGKKEWVPADVRKWCEIWTTALDEKSMKNFLNIAESLNIKIQKERIEFPERTVFLGKVNKNDLNDLIFLSDNIAEFRRAAEAKVFFTEMPNSEQTEWVNDAISRIKKSPNYESVSVCILDTGINNGHPLLIPVLQDEDCDAYNPAWNVNDHEGHGTLMAGVAQYNDLEKILENNEDVNITHILESAKILPPPPGNNEPRLYGAITTQSISNKIINHPKRRQIFCMAVTTDEFNSGDGHPSSWSAEIDAITSGKVDKIKKIMIISAGNMDAFKHYFEENITSSIENPGQSWNAITVGAYTNLIPADSRDSALAPQGGLSPYSTTSRLWDRSWPIKPEIVLEGGNRLIDKQYDANYQTDELSELSTNYKPQENLLSALWGTSLATAKTAYLAAKIQAAYPNAWPETVRGLIIHSANWTDAMKKQFLNGDLKKDYYHLLRTCGYGIPNLRKAIQCAGNSVSLVVESELKPYKKEKSEWKTNDMELHEIPWPKDLLLKYGKTKFRLKVTLSYFIEPCPGELGWKDKYRYASCGLRFKTNGVMTRSQFISSITKAMESDDETDAGSSMVEWTLGESRDVGSVHSDYWETTAAQLSTSNLIAVYPVVGWWRELRRQKCGDNKIRYSLIVTIETPEENVDIYTPIANKISGKIHTKNLVEISRKRQTKK